MRRADNIVREQGFTLVEVSILLTVVVILSATIAPVLSGFIADTRLIAARTEMAAIAEGLRQFLQDLGCDIVPQHDGSSGSWRKGVVVAPFLAPPVAPNGGDGAGRAVSEFRRGSPCSSSRVCDGDPVELLISAGDRPAVGPDGDDFWVTEPDGEWVDYLEFFLISNTPGSTTNRAFPTLADCEPFGRRWGGSRAWRGAYLNVGSGDPWGNRYMINTAFLASTDGEDVIILSAGPDQEVDSEFQQDGFVAGDDDIALLFSAGQ